MGEPVIYQRRLHTVADVYFQATAPRVHADVLEVMQVAVPVPGAACTRFNSIVIDLDRTPEALWRGMNRTTRYEVGRASTRDGVTYQSPKEFQGKSLDAFIDFYQRFAQLKGLVGPDRPRLEAHANAGVLDISLVCHPDGRELVWHAYHRGDKRVVLMHSASVLGDSTDPAFRNLVGRANRFHHWQDLLYFQSRGLATYDLGGWAGDGGDRTLRGVDAFKEGFGGRVAREFNCTVANSARGVAILALRRLRPARVRPGRAWRERTPRSGP